MSNEKEYTEDQLMMLWYEEELKQRQAEQPELRDYIPEDYELQSISQLHECHGR